MSDMDSGDYPPGFDPGDYEVAGYLPLGEDFSDGYVNTEDWNSVPDEVFTSADYIVVHDIENDIYATIAGPFEDYDDWVEAIAEWYEQGS